MGALAGLGEGIIFCPIEWVVISPASYIGAKTGEAIHKKNALTNNHFCPAYCIISNRYTFYSRCHVELTKYMKRNAEHIRVFLKVHFLPHERVVIYLPRKRSGRGRTPAPRLKKGEKNRREINYP